jgi:hypothetical protein
MEVEVEVELEVEMESLRWDAEGGRWADVGWEAQSSLHMEKSNANLTSQQESTCQR